MDGSSSQVEVAINANRYDGRGRRIMKKVRDSADLDATYHYYYDGDSLIETYNGSGEQAEKVEVTFPPSHPCA